MDPVLGAALAGISGMVGLIAKGFWDAKMSRESGLWKTLTAELHDVRLDTRKAQADATVALRSEQSCREEQIRLNGRIVELEREIIELRAELEDMRRPQ